MRCSAQIWKVARYLRRGLFMTPVKNSLLSAAMCLVLATFPVTAGAGDYYVATTGTNTSGGGSAGNPWKTITYALSQITGTGHTLHVAAGTYNTGLGETFPLNMKNGVSLQGDGAATTILDAIGANKTVVNASSIASPTKLDGFTITNGNATGYTGGGIHSKGCTWTVSNCIITDNRSAYYGGGVNCELSDKATFSNCEITYNTSGGGGGAEIYYRSAPTFINCTIGHNVASSGGGFMVESSGTGYGFPKFINCMITDNSATVRGGAMYGASGSALFTNCTIAGNSAGNGSALSGMNSGATRIVNSIIWGNTGATYEIQRASTSWTFSLADLSYSDVNPSNIEPAVARPGSNNLNADPLFVGGGDYHLQGAPMPSPCIDAGTDNLATYPDLPLRDIDGENRPQGTTYDMGADEYPAGPVCVDNDNDGYGVCPDCGINNGCVFDGDDCDDSDDAVYPGAAEIPCNGVDENCNGMADDGPDSDGDGTNDCIDGCPSDPNKTAPGACGCGVPETGDSDGDGTANCNDGCPNDSNKTAPGDCGCGVPETGDSDSDGAADCVDAFPSDPTEWLDTDVDGTGNNADPDDDNDDLPDAWELSYGLDPLSASAGNGKAGDPDNDGWTNHQEYLNGTDPTYAPNIPAHSITSYGVNRVGVDYPVGYCANCHDALNESTCGEYPLMFFAPVNPQSQTENFCFQCHKGAGSVQEGGIVNADYSKTFGGASTADHTNIRDSFNAASSHNLATILNWAVTNHPEWGFTSASNPCSLCHDSHSAKGNWRRPQDPLYTAIRRPSQAAVNPINLWGDDTGERMNSAWSTYQAPYYRGGDYEPGGTTSTDGSKHPDYATLCLDCHSEIAVGVRAGINWSNDTAKVPRPANTWGPIHGEFSYNFSPSLGYLNAPFSGADYVLSCLDCHEPHGSSNPYMLRTTVNAVSGLTYNRSNNSSVQAWCEACHTLTPELEDPLYCGGGSLCHDGVPSPVHFNKQAYCVNCHNHAPNTQCALVHGTCP